MHRYLRIAAKNGYGMASSRWWFAAIALVTLLGSKSAKGEPVTLQFDATVTGVIQSPNVDFQLPFSVVNGDVIRGTFTIDPASLIVGTNPQLLPLHFSLQGAELQANRFLATVNATFPVSPPVPPSFSSVRLSRYEPTDVFPPGTENRVPGAGHLIWNPSVFLIGPDNLLSDPTSLRNPSRWNELNLFHELTLDFTTVPHAAADDGVRIRVQASVGTVTAIPEPGSLLLLGSGVLFGFGVWHSLLRRA
jgi:hypothetical protein